MNVELLTVIEVGCGNQGIKPPDHHGWWNYPNEWDTYQTECLRRAGFEHRLTPYASGSPFYRPPDLGADDLLKIVANHLVGFRKGEWALDEIRPLFGGYVLRVDGHDELFPQCCGDLSDISFWTRVAQGEYAVGWEGHPCIEVRQRGGFIDLICKDNDDPFTPDTKELVTIEAPSLALSVANARRELEQLEGRLATATTSLGLAEMAKRLIWGI